MTLSADARLIIRTVSAGHCTEMRLLGMMMSQTGCKYDEAETRTKNAIVEAVQGGFVELFPNTGIYVIKEKNVPQDDRTADTEKIYGRKVRASGEAGGLEHPALNSDGSGQ